MEPVTHFLTGACIARTGFNRKTALATVAMTLAAEASDIDIVAYVKGSAFGFVHHRGFTHTVWGIPFVAAFVVGVLWAWMKVWRRTHPEKPGTLPLRWGLLFLFSCFAGYSHLLLDFTNNYGVRPLWPLVNHWYAWSIVFILEPVILLILIAALVLPALFGLVSQEIGARQKGPRGRGAAIAALVAIVMLWGIRDFEHRRALAALDSLEYGGQAPTRVFASPKPINPFQWYGIVETDSRYELLSVDSLRPEVSPNGRSYVYFKSPDTEITRAAKDSYLGRGYLDWAMFPVLEMQPRNAADSGATVVMKDLRFVMPDRNRSAVTAYVDLDSKLHVEGQGFVHKNNVRDGKHD